MKDDVRRRVVELHDACLDLAERASAAGEEDLARDARSMVESLVEPAPGAASESPWMARHREWVERLHERDRLRRANRAP